MRTPRQEYLKRWQAANRSKRRAAVTRWRKSHPEAVWAAKRRNYRRHPEKTIARTLRRRVLHRSRLSVIKQSTPCKDCGRFFPAECMDFDHLPGREKIGAVGRMPGLSWAKIEREISKCDLVCACCHRIRTKARKI